MTLLPIGNTKQNPLEHYFIPGVKVKFFPPLLFGEVFGPLDF
jgi:hypothetical protein